MSTKSEKEVLTSVAEQLSGAKKTIASILKGTQYEGSLGVSISASLDKHVNQLGHLGSATNVVNDAANEDKFPPITNFMGEELELRKPLKAADLKPTPTAAEAYAGRVNDLYATFTDRSNEAIQNSHTTKEDIRVLRGVAKKAGLEDFKTRAIDNQFLEDIKDAIRKQEGEAEADDDFDAEMSAIEVAKSKPKPDSTKPGTNTGKAAAAKVAPDAKLAKEIADDVTNAEPIGTGTTGSTQEDTRPFPDNLEDIKL